MLDMIYIYIIYVIIYMYIYLIFILHLTSLDIDTGSHVDGIAEPPLKCHQPKDFTFTYTKTEQTDGSPLA